MSSRWPATRLRYSPARASMLGGMRSGATPRASRNQRTASAGDTGMPDGSKPRRFTYSWPSGNSCATCRAQCTASAVFPIPAVPLIAVIPTVPAAASSSPFSADNSDARPTNNAGAAGSCRGTGGAGVVRPGAATAPEVTATAAAFAAGMSWRSTRW